MTANRNAALLECPSFLLELAAIEIGVSLCTLENRIKFNDDAAIESIEAVILDLGDRVRNLQNERRVLGKGGAP